MTPVIYSVDSGYAGFAAELPGATGQGKTIEEIREAVEELVDEYRMRKVTILWSKLNLCKLQYEAYSIA
ncbi:hypothetical protein DRQ29_02795 [bacterium]|nr:MAG: hypothetical protein DRQ29_02795 [bacterium]